MHDNGAVIEPATTDVTAGPLENEQDNDEMVPYTESGQDDEDEDSLDRYFSLETSRDVALNMDMPDDHWDTLDE